jgi:hypothetical protein
MWGCDGEREKGEMCVGGVWCVLDLCQPGKRSEQKKQSSLDRACFLLQLHMLPPPARHGGRTLIRGTCLAWSLSAPSSSLRPVEAPRPSLPLPLRATARKPMQAPASSSPADAAAEAATLESYPVTVSVKNEAALEAARAAFGNVRGVVVGGGGRQTPRHTKLARPDTTSQTFPPIHISRPPSPPAPPPRPPWPCRPPL